MDKDAKIEFTDKFLTSREKTAFNFRIALMSEIVKARIEKGISQKKLSEMSGVKQPIIARMEKGYTSPQIDTVLKVSIRAFRKNPLYRRFALMRCSN